jgi:hypothetical protein
MNSTNTYAYAMKNLKILQKTISSDKFSELTVTKSTHETYRNT